MEVNHIHPGMVPAYMEEHHSENQPKNPSTPSAKKTAAAPKKKTKPVNKKSFAAKPVKKVEEKTEEVKTKGTTAKENPKP